MRLPLILIARMVPASIGLCMVLGSQVACVECNVAADCLASETCTADGSCRRSPGAFHRFDNEPESDSLERAAEPTPEAATADLFPVDAGSPIDAGTVQDAGSIAEHDAGSVVDVIEDAGVFDEEEEEDEDAGVPDDVTPLCTVVDEAARTCADATVLDSIGDECSFFPDDSSTTGTLDDGDEDAFIVFANDATNTFCDTFEDSFLVVATLDAPPGVELCTATIPKYPDSDESTVNEVDELCALETERECGGDTRVVVEGVKGRWDDAYTVVWVRFAPGNAPSCANYTLTVDANAL